MIRTIEQSPLSAKLEQELNTALVREGEVFPGSLAPVIARNKNGKKSFFPMQIGRAHV